MTVDALRTVVEQRGIKRAKIGGFDVDGILRGKYVALDKLWSVVDKGFGFCDVIFGWDLADQLYDNAKVTGWHTGYPDANAKIDPATARILRYEPDTVHLLADFWGEDGKPHPACPRNVLKRVIARAEAKGYAPMCSAEFEFWVFQETPESLVEKGHRNLVPLSPGMFGYSWLRSAENGDFVHDVLDTFEEYRVPIEGFHTETGPGVYEAALAYTTALEAADRAALFKTTLKHLAHRHGLAVTFMAKWNAKLPGSSGHLHESLWDSAKEKNLFSDPKAEHGLSDLGRRFVGGQLALMPDLTAVCSPFVNSYKRYVPGVWAPLNATWGIENRTCAVRVINGPSPSAVRSEYRQTAADINPYLAIAASLGAGLYGIEHGIEPGPPSGGDASGADAGAPLPRTLREATARLAASEGAREVLGEAFVDHYVRTRDFECREHERAVSDWELARYFETV